MNIQEEKPWYNCWRMQLSSTTMLRYAYVDRKKHIADQIFLNEGIKVNFKEEMVQDNAEYCLVFCEIRKKDLEKFCTAIKKLLDNMLLLGYEDYKDVCLEVMSTMEQSK